MENDISFLTVKSNSWTSMTTPVKYKLFQKYTDILKNLLIRRDGSVQNKKIEKAGLVLKASDSDTTPEELDKLSRP